MICHGVREPYLFLGSILLWLMRWAMLSLYLRCPVPSKNNFWNWVCMYSFCEYFCFTGWTWLEKNDTLTQGDEACIHCKPFGSKIKPIANPRNLWMWRDCMARPPRTEVQVSWKVGSTSNDSPPPFSKTDIAKTYNSLELTYRLQWNQWDLGSHQYPVFCWGHWNKEQHLYFYAILDNVFCSWFCS